MRLGDIARLRRRPFADLAAIHAQRPEDLLPHQCRVWLAGGCRGHLAGHHVEQVVVGVVGAEAAGRLEVRQPGDDVLAAEVVGLRPQHQVAGAQPQAAVVDQQVADLHVARHPWVVHAERGQVPGYRIVPAQAPGLHQPRQHRRGHRLGVGGDLEQRVAIDMPSLAGDQLAAGGDVHHLAVLDHAHCQARQAVMLEGLLHRRVVERGIGIGGGCGGVHDARQQGEAQQDRFHRRAPCRYGVSAVAGTDGARACSSDRLRP